MASQTSLKDLSKAITAFTASPQAPLPDDLTETIGSYLQRHSKYEEAAADRLQEELVSIFDKHVRGNQEASSVWVGVIRQLLPILQTAERVTFWVDILKETLSERSPHEKGIVDETIGSLMDIVSFAVDFQDNSEGDEPLNAIMHHMFTIWMDCFYPAFVKGVAGMEFNERIFRQAIIQFGKMRPQQFFASLDSFFVQSQHRKAALRFLCDFIQSHPPHLHQILQGTMFKNLLTCLQEDTSTVVVSSALTALIMLLPHMPSSLVPHLPVLFNIYARLLFWTQEKAGVTETPSHDPDKFSGWEACEHVSGASDEAVSHLANYYTILYGLYPINFMDYIRKPQRYLRHANMADADDIEIQPTEMRDRSEQFRRCHLLHPNFHTLTIDSEKSDLERWIQSEAAEVIAQCMELYVGTEKPIAAWSLPTGAIDEKRALATVGSEDNIDSALLHRSMSGMLLMDGYRSELKSRNDSSSTIARLDSRISLVSDWGSPEIRGRASTPDGQRLLAKSTSHSQLRDIMDATRGAKVRQSISTEGNDSDTTSHQDMAKEQSIGQSQPPVESSDPTPLMAELAAQVSHLQRQNFMLQNDLSFERYQKQQHIAHIGELRRKQVSQAATEAETQNLIIMNRNFKGRYEDAKKAEMQVRKESEKSRAVAKKWEADLSTKMKNLRDQYQKTATELQAVRTDLEATQQECEKLRQLVCDGEVKELNWKQNMQSIELHAAEVERLRAKADRLGQVEQECRMKEEERSAAVDAAVFAENRVEEMIMKLAAIESESQQTRNVFQEQIVELQAKLAQAQEQVKPPVTIQRPEIQGILESSRARQAEMQHQYDMLIRKYTALQSSLLDMQSGATPEQIKHEVSSGPLTGSPEYPSQGSTSPVRTRIRPRVFSNPEVAPDATSYNVTPPLEGKLGSVGASTSGARPATPSATEGGPPPVSPEQRYHGRGGVQNVRKDGKGKQKEEDVAAGSTGGKKEKKSSGLRGFRSGVNDFVRGKTD